MGPTNKTWHKEMRDFRVSPQFEYCSHQYQVMGFDEVSIDGVVWPLGQGNYSKPSNDFSETSSTEQEEDIVIPRVLIAYGMEVKRVQRKLRRVSCVALSEL